MNRPSAHIALVAPFVGVLAVAFGIPEITKGDDQSSALIGRIHEAWAHRQNLLKSLFCRISATTTLNQVDVSDDDESNGTTREVPKQRDISFQWSRVLQIDFVNGRIARETNGYAISSNGDSLIPRQERLLFDGKSLWKHTPRRDLATGDEARRVELSELPISDITLLFPYEDYPLYLALGYVSPDPVRFGGLRHDTRWMELRTNSESEKGNAVTVTRRVQQNNSAQEVSYRMDPTHGYVVIGVESITKGNVFGGNTIVTTLKYADFDDGYWLPSGWLVEVKSGDVLLESHEITVVEYAINPDLGDEVFQIGDPERLLYPGALFSQNRILKEVAPDGSLVPLGSIDSPATSPSKPTARVFRVVIVGANAVAVILACVLYWRSRARK
jgi:hypothetical protein